MQLKYLYKKLSNASNGLDGTDYSVVVYEGYSTLRSYDQLKKQHCNDEVIFKVLKVPRSTFFRWKQFYEKEGLPGLEDKSKTPKNTPRKKYNSTLEELVLKIRKENPIWGKKKIFIILKRDYGIKSSVSTVGRIISFHIKAGTVRPFYFYFGRLKEKKKREFNKHAKRLQYGMKSREPGELVQVDHTVIEVEPGRYVKQFDATCSFTKYTVSQAYSRATSNIAAQFLEFMKQGFPFKIKSIQVDGGSEFMDKFEEACKENNIKLFVLPPRSPEINGNVERRHGTIKYEFFSTYDGSANLDELRPELQAFMEKYNNYRPHESLDFETPESFYLKLKEA